MSSVSGQHAFLLICFVFLVAATPILARKRHVITFRSPNLFPESHTWDRSAQHFLVGSLNRRSIHAVSDAGVVETLIYDPDLPANVSILGLSIDTVHRRLLAVVHALEPLPPFNALAAYDLRSRRRLFLSSLPNGDTDCSRQIAKDVAVDFNGNAFVTNAGGNFIWKVTADGDATIFSRSPAFSSHKIYEDQPWSFRGLNGISYISKGYLLVVQTNTGKMFKVDAEDGKARLVLLPKDLPAAEGIAVRSDGVAVVVSQNKAWLLKSQDSWGEGAVYDETALDSSRFPTSVAIREDDRAYVLYGHVNEGVVGNVEREAFAIEEIESKREGEEENVWVFVLIGLGLAYVVYWRFQMGQLAKNMSKKTN